MKAIKINTEDRKLEMVEINNWTEIAPEIGNGCTTFACPVSFDNGDTIYIDDEGLYNDFGGGFITPDWDYPIVGNAIILGTDSEGESIDAVTTIEELQKQIFWVSREDCVEWQNQVMIESPKIFFL